MRVTVVIPSIPPRRDFLAEAFASVLAQTRSPDAISVVIDHHHEGPAVTRNKGLFSVQTEWVAFLDDDDLLFPRHLERLLAHAEETEADLVYPWFWPSNGIDPLGWFAEPFDPIVLRRENYIPVTTLVRTDLAQKVGGFPRALCDEWPRPFEDHGFLVRLLDAGAKFEHLPEVTWLWRYDHGGNLAGQTWA
jgi:glycosyltransferase involved in cell wall biosynthesis